VPPIQEKDTCGNEEDNREVEMRGDITDTDAGICPTCGAPTLTATHYEFYGGPKLIGYFCRSCLMHFTTDKKEYPLSLQVEAMKFESLKDLGKDNVSGIVIDFVDPKSNEKDMIDVAVKRWNACYKECGHKFGVIGDDGERADVECIRCGYGCIMRLEKTKDFPEFWEALGEYLEIPELAMMARSIIDDIVEQGRAQAKFKSAITNK